jgi:hypothetical protein
VLFTPIITDLEERFFECINIQMLGNVDDLRKSNVSGE